MFTDKWFASLDQPDCFVEDLLYYKPTIVSVHVMYLEAVVDSHGRLIPGCEFTLTEMFDDTRLSYSSVPDTHHLQVNTVWLNTPKSSFNVEYLSFIPTQTTLRKYNVIKIYD